MRRSREEKEAEMLQQLGLPKAEAILADTLKVDVCRILLLTQDYRVVRVPKKSDGFRTLFIPSEELKAIQKKILQRFLHKMWNTFHDGLYGLYPGGELTSYAWHAERHKDAKWFWQLDLVDAFPSTSVWKLKKIIFNRIVSELEAYELDVSHCRALTQRMDLIEEAVEMSSYVHDLEDAKKHLSFSFFYRASSILDGWLFEDDGRWLLAGKTKIAKALAELVIKLTTWNYVLPQGTPTAPFLFYIYLTESGFFSELCSLCPSPFFVFFTDNKRQDKFRFEVGMYVDNIVVSAQKPIPEDVQKKFYEAIEKYGFKPNSKKVSHRGIIHAAPLITGLRIIKDEEGNGKIVLPKKTVRRWRGIIYRAISDPSLRPKVEGFVASLKPIYGKFCANGSFDFNYDDLPAQIAGPYYKLLHEIQTEKK